MLPQRYTAIGIAKIIIIIYAAERSAGRLARAQTLQNGPKKLSTVVYTVFFFYFFYL